MMILGLCYDLSYRDHLYDQNVRMSMDGIAQHQNLLENATDCSVVEQFCPKMMGSMPQMVFTCSSCSRSCYITYWHGVQI